MKKHFVLHLQVNEVFSRLWEGILEMGEVMEGDGIAWLKSKALLERVLGGVGECKEGLGGAENGLFDVEEGIKRVLHAVLREEVTYGGDMCIMAGSEGFASLTRC